MNAFIVIHATLLLAGIVNLTVNFFKWKAAKKAAGEVKRCWSTKLDPRIPKNRWNWLIIALFWIVNIYYLLSSHSWNVYSPIVIFILAMSFAPRWGAAVGSQGIALGTKVIPWKEVLEKTINKKGAANTLILKRALSDDHSSFSEISIPCPDNRLFSSLEAQH